MDCCPEEERKECDYDACSDYSEGVDFKSSFQFIDFPILQGAVLNIMLPILIMTLTLSQLEDWTSKLARRNVLTIETAKFLHGGVRSQVFVD